MLPRRASIAWPALRLPLLLYLLTAASTALVGGWLYGAAIMAILTAHELGHFFACRHYGVRSSYPYFLPMPFSPFGTFGAVIKMSGAIPHRRALFDIGIAGPLAGMALALPVTVLGLMLSRVTALSPAAEGMQLLGDSLLFKGLSWLIFGKLPRGADIVLHPLAYAGWVGFFVTALNLLPIGQLDGGHINYALWCGRARHISAAVLLAFAGLAFFYPHWILLLLLLLLVVRLRHPPTAADDLPLSPGRFWLGIAAFLLFLLLFIPEPMQLRSF